MTPIAGSEATDDRSDGRRSAELRPNLMTGEQRREQERKALEEEERRVEMAAREYLAWQSAKRQEQTANRHRGALEVCPKQAPSRTR